MSFYKQTGYVGAGLLLSGVGGLIMNIGLGRVLTGEEYGLFRIFFSAILITGWILAFGIERDVTADISAGKSKQTVVSSTLIFVVVLSGLFISIVVLTREFLIQILGLQAMLLPFTVGTLTFVGYRYTMGLLKGYELMREVGIQNILLGIGKIGVVVFAAILNWQAFRIGLYIAGIFTVASLFSLIWLWQPTPVVQAQLPSVELVRRVGLSTAKQVGDVIVKFGGPVIVSMTGGTSLEAGIFAGTLTLAFIPFYGYNAIINNILPEVSKLNADGDIKGIGQRVGFLLEVSAILLFSWVTFGTLVGSSIISIVYRPTFIISTVGAFSIFFISSAVIISSLLTEVLIGIDNQRAIGQAWIVPLVLLPIAVVAPWPPIISTGVALTLYVTAVICLLGNTLRTSHIPVSWTGFDYGVFY